MQIYDEKGGLKAQVHDVAIEIANSKGGMKVLLVNVYPNFPILEANA